MHLCSPINQVNIITVSLLPYIHRRNKSKRMKEAVFWDFFFLFCQRWCTTGLFCTVLCICMYKHIYKDIRVCLLEKVHAPSPSTQPTAPYRSDSTVQKTSKQTRHRHAAARKCVFFPLTLSVFAVVLCGVRSHTTPARLPLRPVLKSDPPAPPTSRV